MAQKTMKVSPTAYERVTEVKKSLEAYERRQVTYSEVLDELVRHWQVTEQLVRDAREAGR